MATSQSKRLPKKQRQGAAIVEFAVCMPLLVVVFLASIEITNGIYLRQAGTTAGYEAARLISKQGGTEVAAKARAAEVLEAHSIVDAVVLVSPSVNENTERGTPVTVSVQIPADNNTSGFVSFLRSRLIETNTTMVRQ